MLSIYVLDFNLVGRMTKRVEFQLKMNVCVDNESEFNQESGTLDLDVKSSLVNYWFVTINPRKKYPLPLF